MRKLSAHVFIFFTICLSGCSTTQGPQSVISANGPTNTSATTGIAKLFTDAAVASYDSPDDTGLAQTMMKNGFALTYASCSDYFLSAGDTQKWIIVSRDVVGAVGSLATAILALHSGGKNAAANVAIATGIGFTSLNIYTKNFLFAAENISSVRTLITRALSTHQQVVESIGTVTYETALVALFDNQEICSPMKIAALAREAIQKGDVIAATSPEADIESITQAQDQKALETLGKILNPPGALSIDQAGALWWLLKDSSSDTEKTMDIAPKLKDLPSTKNPFKADGALTPDWHNEQVADALNGFSRATKTSFRTTIAAAKIAKAKESKINGIMNDTSATTPLFQGGSTLPRAASTHVSVGIR